MIYISTDYVFDGTKDGEYSEDDIPNPINVYGKTKYEREIYVREITLSILCLDYLRIEIY